jgi:hypothetical protein
VPPVASAIPAWHAPARARLRAVSLLGSASTWGRASHRARAPSRASGAESGLAPAAHSASRQWATAFSPLAAEVSGGRV